MVRALISWSCTLSLAVIQGSEQMGTEQMGLLQRKHRGQVGDELTHGVQTGTQGHISAGNSALADLFHSTENLLRSGATPEVVKLASETLDEIKETVIPAIEEAHKNDVAKIASGLATFDHAQADYTLQLEELANLRATDRSFSQQHTTCRDRERGDCELAAECERKRQQLWNVYMEKKDVYTQVIVQIHDRQCVLLEKETWDYPVNGHTSDPIGGTHMVHSSWKTRNETVDEFGEFKIAGAEYFVAKNEYDEHYKVCVQRNATHDATTAECNGGQSQLEISACARSSRRLEVVEDLASVWQARVDSYAELVAAVKLLEEDRKKEFTTLATVECLLDRIHERGGQGCDESTGEANQEIGKCQDLNTDTTDLNLEYPEAPPKPADPDIFPEPCDDTWETEEYGTLTGFCFENLQPCASCSLAA